MVDGEYSTDNYSYLKTSIGAIIKNPEKLELVLDCFKTKNIAKMLFKSCFFYFFMFLIDIRPKKRLIKLF